MRLRVLGGNESHRKADTRTSSNQSFEVLNDLTLHLQYIQNEQKVKVFSLTFLKFSSNLFLVPFVNFTEKTKPVIL